MIFFRVLAQYHSCPHGQGRQGNISYALITLISRQVHVQSTCTCTSTCIRQRYLDPKPWSIRPHHFCPVSTWTGRTTQEAGLRGPSSSTAHLLSYLFRDPKLSDIFYICDISMYMYLFLYFLQDKISTTPADFHLLFFTTERLI